METLEQLQEELVIARKNENEALQKAWRVLTTNVSNEDISERIVSLLMVAMIKATKNEPSRVEVPFTLLGTLIMNRMFIEKKIDELTD